MVQQAAANLDRVMVGERPLSVEDVVAVASGSKRVALATHAEFEHRVTQSRMALLNKLSSGERIYGVTTGFAESQVSDVGGPHLQALGINLVRLHGCGTGATLSDMEARATIIARLASLASGHSAIRLVVLQALTELLAADITPQIPAEGSAGASGELTPLSYVAAVLSGERSVRYRGQVMPAAEALKQANLAALQLEPKESLALMNGTSVMTGLGCLALARASSLARLAAALSAMAVDVLQGEARHFDDRIFKAKPHPGQRAVARWMREDLDFGERRFPEATSVQDPYSLRCAPHVIGVLVDSLPFLRRLLEIELNSASDNPLLDPESGDLLHGGNFYGGHVCHAMDLLKSTVANIADLLDRQLVLLCNPHANRGLPANLVAPRGGAEITHHGFKAMQHLTSALAAEACKLSMPASVFSRSTENHDQDKVSMGTVAARECLRSVELAETVAVVHLLSLCQAVDLRQKQGCHRRALALHAQVRRLTPMNTFDRPMDADIRSLLDELRSSRLDFGPMDFNG